jgi:hypothetical protein
MNRSRIVYAASALVGLSLAAILLSHLLNAPPRAVETGQATVTTGRGFTVRIPKAWTAVPVPNPQTDIVFLAKDQQATGPITPGLIIRRTPADFFSIDKDLPGLIMANQFQHPAVTVQRREHIIVGGAKEAVILVSEYVQSGVHERILDIVARTPSNVAYHFQAIAPREVLTDITISAILESFAVS